MTLLRDYNRKGTVQFMWTTEQSKVRHIAVLQCCVRFRQQVDNSNKLTSAMVLCCAVPYVHTWKAVLHAVQ
jgi:hypothetical protein